MSRSHTALTLSLVAVSLAWFVHFWPHFHAANESIRLYFVQAVVDEGTPAIDGPLRRYRQNNSDKAVFEGHAYMDKAPGLSLVAMPAYWALTRVFGVGTRFDKLPGLMWALTLLGIVIPAVFGIWAIRQIVRDWTGDDRAAWTAALIGGLATPYTIYATLFFGHGLAAALAIGSFWLLRRDRFVWAGVLAGGMVLTDTATAPLALILGLYAGLRRRDLRALIEFGLGGLPLVAIQLAYNTWCFGEPFRFAYAYKAAADLAAIHNQGVYGFSLPTFAALFGLSVGAMRGLFFHAPVLLAGLWALRGRGQGPLRRDGWALLAIVGLYFVWIAAFVDWPAGASYGPRHLVPLIPFLSVGMGLLLHAHPRAIRLIAPLAVASGVASWTVIATFPYAPGALDAPLFQLGLPMLLSGEVSPTVGGLLGLPHTLFWALSVPALALSALVWLQKPRLGTVGLAATGLLLVAAAAALSPESGTAQIRSRATAEAFLGYPHNARALCERHSLRWIERAWACVPQRQP